jgi:hypothetical protein
MPAGGRLRGYRFIGKQRQRAATPFATQAALARSDTLGFVRLVRLLPLRWRQTGIVWGFRRFAELCFEIGNPPLGRLKALPKGTDQGVLLGVAQVVEVGGSGTPRLESTRP